MIKNCELEEEEQKFRLPFCDSESVRILPQLSISGAEANDAEVHFIGPREHEVQEGAWLTLPGSHFNLYHPLSYVLTYLTHHRHLLRDLRISAIPTTPV